MSRLLRHPSRRRFLETFGLSALAAPFAGLLAPPVRAGSGTAERVIFFYFPDGVAGPSQAGESSLWHASGSEYDFYLPDQLSPLSAFQDRCLFLNGLSMGATDSGSHPGGASKLLTAVDHGNGESIDQYLARTVGYDSPWRHLYLGAQANYNSASGDKHISYPVAGQSVTPEDDPRVAFASLFSSGTTASSSGSSSSDSGSSGSGDAGAVPNTDERKLKVLDAALADLNTLHGQVSGTEAEKVELHMESLYELENRLDGLSTGSGSSDSGDDEEETTTWSSSCEDPTLDIGGVSDDTLYDHGTFPDILRAQIDTMVLAMECGLTRVGTIQCSHHTSELIMSRFPDSEMYDPGYDMRSHQASHYGDSHDWEKMEFDHFVKQRRWFVQQFVYLLEQLDARAEGSGTMLDNTIVVLCTEVCDGNTHLHDDMPFVVAGGAGGAYATGRLLQYGYAPHGNLWVSVAQAMGEGIGSFGSGYGAVF